MILKNEKKNMLFEKNKKIQQIKNYCVPYQLPFSRYYIIQNCMIKRVPWLKTYKNFESLIIYILLYKRKII